jgi:hypothetical protein
MHVDLEPRERRARERPRGRPVDPGRPGAVAGVLRDVLGDGHRADETEVLVDERHTEVGHRARRPRTRKRRPRERNRPAVLVVDGGEDPHERRLARPVLAQERVDLAAADREVDPGQRGGAAVDLRQAADLQHRRCGDADPWRVRDHDAHGCFHSLS